LNERTASKVLAKVRKNLEEQTLYFQHEAPTKLGKIRNTKKNLS
jgi:hypothetical protein